MLSQIRSTRGKRWRDVLVTSGVAWRPVSKTGAAHLVVGSERWPD